MDGSTTLGDVMNYVSIGGLVVTISVIYKAILFIKDQSKKELEIQTRLNQNDEAILEIKNSMTETKNKFEMDQRELMRKVDSYAEKTEHKIDEVKTLLMNYFMKKQQD